MDEKQILIELGIDPKMSIADIKKALEKKKQGLLRKLNAVFGNTAKEQELNHQLDQVEQLLIQMNIQQTVGKKTLENEQSALLSNVENVSTIRLDQFETKTRELSQTQIAPEDDLSYQKARAAAVDFIKNNAMDDAYEQIAAFDPEKHPELYLLLGLIHGTANGTYTNLEKSFECLKRGAECGEAGCYLSLAEAYQKGLGTAVDETLAIAWYEKASQVFDDGIAERHLGELYSQKKQYKEMFVWYQLGMYESNSWECRIGFADALLKHQLGSSYNEKAMQMIQVELNAEGNDARERRRRAYAVLLDYYSRMSKQDTIYRNKELEVICALADGNYVPCAGLAAHMYLIGYAGKPELAKAIHYFEMAVERGETVDRAEYDKAKREFRRQEKINRIDENPFTAADAELLIAQTRRSGSDVLRIPEGYTKLNSDAFEAYKGKGFFKKSFFKEIVLPDSMLSVGDRALQDLKGLKKFNLPQNIVEIGWSAFQADHAYVEELVIPGDIEIISSWAFYGTDFGTVKIEEGVKEIRAEAFAFCKIRRLELPGSLRRIDTRKDNCTFYYAEITEEATVPKSMEDALKQQAHFRAKHITFFE